MPSVSLVLILLPSWKRKGYHKEASYIRTVWNWRRANDERGLSSLQRCKYNYQFLQMILKDLMPWYKEMYDFSQLEVNRYVVILCAFYYYVFLLLGI